MNTIRFTLFFAGLLAYWLALDWVFIGFYGQAGVSLTVAALITVAFMHCWEIDP